MVHVVSFKIILDILFLFLFIYKFCFSTVKNLLYLTVFLENRPQCYLEQTFFRNMQKCDALKL